MNLKQGGARVAVVGGNMSPSDWINIVIGLVTLAGVIGVFFQLQSLNRQTRMQNFAEYTRRYKDIVLEFPEDINDKGFVLDKKRKDYDDLMRYMRAYYDLCFEEWYLHGKGDIGDDYWEIWRDGMKTAFSKTAFQQAWHIMQSDTNFGPDFGKFVGQLTGYARSEHQ